MSGQPAAFAAAGQPMMYAGAPPPPPGQPTMYAGAPPPQQPIYIMAPPQAAPAPIIINNSTAASASATATTTARARPTPDHVCHCLLCCFSGGLWLPIWIAACFHLGCEKPCH